MRAQTAFCGGSLHPGPGLVFLIRVVSPHGTVTRSLKTCYGPLGPAGAKPETGGQQAQERGSESEGGGLREAAPLRCVLGRQMGERAAKGSVAPSPGDSAAWPRSGGKTWPGAARCSSGKLPGVEGLLKEARMERGGQCQEVLTVIC